MQNQNNLTLHLTLDEVNTILTSLGNLPYVQVYELIQKIQGQAGAQVQQETEQTIKDNGQGMSILDKKPK